jgi:hypothetical protein
VSESEIVGKYDGAQPPIALAMLLLIQPQEGS